MIDWRGLRVGEPDDDLPPLDPDEQSAPAWRIAVEIVLLVLLAGVIAIGVKAFVAQAFYIPSGSMEPQLEVGDRVVVSRLAYELHEPRRGDIVVFDDPEAVPEPDDDFVVVRLGRDALEGVGILRPSETELIKRVIGLPGETVQGIDGEILVDGRPLLEPYLAIEVTTPSFGPVEIPDDHVFVMGDNRSNSKDSRIFGPVPTDSIVGRAIARVWPPGRTAYL